jgi:pyruvate kinase
MTELDREHLSVAVELDADFVAASFVRTAADVVTIRNYLEEMRDAHRLPDSFRIPRIIAKIESAEALQHFDEILKVSDGIMVARGDLAVEIPFSVVTRAQKMIVGKCNAAGKPVVVATQMLESMIDNPRPTRAEVSDVVNAIYDGADCVMLSGESAKGKYPTESVRTLARIAKQVRLFCFAFPHSAYELCTSNFAG